MCPKVGKLKRGYFIKSLGILKIFPYELMVTASLLYVVSAYERFLGGLYF